MRHVTLPRRPPTRRAFAKHRPRPPTWSRVNGHGSALRISDVVLALLGLALLGAFCLGAAVPLLGRALAP